MVEILGQRLEAHDLALVGLLVILEGVLSIDNALVLGLLAKRLPKEQQKRALTYGLVGAFAFRLIAIALAAYLLHWRIVKLFGGAYLIWVSVKHFVFEQGDEPEEKVVVNAEGEPALVEGKTGRELAPERQAKEIEERSPLPTASLEQAIKRKGPGFWATVFVIEMTDIAFAVDSILAAIGVVGSRHEKLWVIVTGGFLGVILMRFAAVVFIKLLERFPRFELSAYLLVLVIGAKLLIDWGFNTPDHPHAVDFHSPRALAFWVFWGLMLGCFLVGFLPGKKPESAGKGGEF